MLLYAIIIPQYNNSKISGGENMLDNIKEVVKFNPNKPALFISEARKVLSHYSSWHEAIEIKYVLKDKINVMVETDVFSVNAGEIVFINPYEVHSNVPSENAGAYTLFMIGLDYFDTVGISNINLRRLMIDSQLRIKRHIKNPEVKKIIEKIIQENSTPKDYSDILIPALMQQLFAILFRDEQDTKKNSSLEDRAKNYKTIEPAVIMLRDNYNKSFSGDSLAHACCLNREYFCRVFKKATGKTPIEYQNECRIRIADLLLKQGNMSIKEISQSVGFEDVSYFSRVYKKIKGISPNQKKSKLS